MDSVIAVLPPHVIDQIAAGEVIERPASVVKELVDNAIDAGARTISVESAAGGRALIRVSDDGCGMSAHDAVACLERHATSKLRAVDDLWGLTSMGFRGEALPSIASVSRMTLTTRRGGDLAATRVVVEASRVISVGEVGAPVGTTVEVADLLHNLPARLKFLKGEATEASHITELIGRVAMSHPALHLRFKHNGRTALEVPPDRDGFARAKALLGARIAPRLLSATGDEGGIRVTAYLAAPELAQATGRGVQLFVGKRPIRDRGLLHAITMGYGELVSRGRYPIAVLLLELPPGAVDINVHPQKHEVRFADASAVHAAVRHVVQGAIAASPWRTELGGSAPTLHVLTSVAPPALPLDGVPATSLSQRYAAQLRQRMPQGQGSLGFDADDTPRAWAAKIQREVRAQRAAEHAEARAEREAIDQLAREAGRAVAALTAVEPPPTVDEPAPAVDESIDAASGAGPHASSYFASLRFLGQLDLTYLVCDGGGELVLLDQHAAHERVELERLRTRAREREATVQRLLFPMTCEATPAELALVARPELAQSLAHVGFEVEPFGKATLAVKAVPAGIRHGDPSQLLRRMLAEWAKDGVPSDDERIERVLAEIACHSVVRAGDRLSTGEAEALLRGLDAIENLGAIGPHGRPILLRLPLSEIARRFGR
ncbi:MAG: DNA mismatch repair endonuclease MutL [Kofleriaceae bacterium]|nr:DNA mismatch repair endonuclease MutL [Kofleriaceae bacterium]